MIWFQKTSDMFVTLSDKNSIEIIKLFGIKISDSKKDSVNLITIIIKADPLFGPIIVMNISGYRKFVRITPLTDRDLNDTFENIKLKNKETQLKMNVQKISSEIEVLQTKKSEVEKEIASLLEKASIDYSETQTKPQCMRLGLNYAVVFDVITYSKISVYT